MVTITLLIYSLSQWPTQSVEHTSTGPHSAMCTFPTFKMKHLITFCTLFVQNKNLEENPLEAAHSTSESW